MVSTIYAKKDVLNKKVVFESKRSICDLKYYSLSLKHHSTTQTPFSDFKHLSF